MKLSTSLPLLAVLLVQPLGCVAQFNLTDCLLNEEHDMCKWAFDGTCDTDCTYDCFDCAASQGDVCAGHHYDCSGCIDAGCYYCASDGLCAEEPLTNDMLEPFEKNTTCGEEQDWVEQCDLSDESSYDDPLYESMKWAYDMIKVPAVWTMGFNGTGIHVRVNDDGVDSNHPEFSGSGKYDIDNSCQQYDPVMEGEGDKKKLGDHGTACASLLLANADNGEGAVGIAHGATVSSCILVGEAASQLDEGNRMSHKLEVVHVSSNSWGPVPCSAKETAEAERRHVRHLTETNCPFDKDHKDSPCDDCAFNLNEDATSECKAAVTKYCSTYYELDSVACANYLDWFVECDYAPLPNEAGAALARGILEGRNGSGIVYTWAAGNDYTTGSDVNGDAYANSRYTISVAAVGKDGKHSSYSTPGACNFISAPGGDSESISNNIVAKPGGGYHDITMGTSFATPTVAGVAALMLQANPSLGWRDVQYILARTAQATDTNDTSWVPNGGGFKHSNKYGFGIVDAEAAVTMALSNYVKLGPEKQILAKSGDINMAIANDASQATTATLDIQVEAGVSFAAESVSVYLDLQHASRGDLKITLTSPNGTESVLHPSMRPEKSNEVSYWKLTTLKNYMENPEGTWTLELRDENPHKLEEGTCMDMEFYAYRMKDDGTLLGSYTCKWFKDNEWCTDGDVTDKFSEIYDKEHPTLNATTACCACGGGNDAYAVEMLVSWDLIVYGSEI